MARPPADWQKPYERWRAELGLPDGTPEDAAVSVGSFLRPVFGGMRDLRWEPARGTWEADVRGVDGMAGRAIVRR
jgi:hypothetical protein